MSTSPIRPTSDVFDESVLKVEFLPLPAQIPDFSLNLNTESLYYRLQTLMSEVFGPVRVQGLGVQYTGGNVVVATGLILHKNYLVRVLAPQSFALVDSPFVVYATITEQLLTSESAPEIVNVNPPLTRVSLPGPNQYRYSIQINYGANVPDDSAGVVHFKICNVSDVGVISNQLPLYTKKLGGFDFFTMETEQADHAMRIATLEASLNQMSAIQLDESVGAGDWLRMVEDGGPKARKVQCSIAPSTKNWGMAVSSSAYLSHTAKLSSTTCVSALYDGSDVKIVIGTNAAGTMTYTLPVSLGIAANSLWVGALDSTHFALAWTIASVVYTRVYTIVNGGDSFTPTNAMINLGNTAGYLYVSGAVLDSTHYVVVSSDYTSSVGHVRGSVVTYASGDITAGTPYLKLTTDGYMPQMGAEAAVALDASTIFVGFRDSTIGKVYGLVGTVAGSAITWGNCVYNSFFSQRDGFGIVSAKLSSTVVVVAGHLSGNNTNASIGTISGTAITWRTSGTHSVTSGYSYRISLVGLDSTHFAMTCLDDTTPRVLLRIASIDGSYNITFGTAVEITQETSYSCTTTHCIAFDSTHVMVTIGDNNLRSGWVSQLASVSGTTATLGNEAYASIGVPTHSPYVALDETHAVVTHRVTSTMIMVRTIEFVGGTFLVRDTKSVTVSGTTSIRLVKLSSSSFVLLYTADGSSSLKCRVCTVAANIITVGAEYQANTTNTDTVSLQIAALSSTKFAVAYRVGNQDFRVRAATVSGTTPTFGTEVVIVSKDTIHQFFNSGTCALVAHDASFLTLFTLGYDDSTDPALRWLEATGVAVSGTTVAIQTATTRLNVPVDTMVVDTVVATKVGNFIVARWIEAVSVAGDTTYQDVIQTVKIIPSTGYIVAVDVTRVSQSGNAHTGIMGLSTSRFALANTNAYGQSVTMFRLTDGGSILRDSAPMAVAGGATDAHVRAIALSASLCLIPTSESSFTFILDDREEVFGVAQEDGSANEWKVVAILGDISTVHSSLVGGVRYGLDTSLALTADASPFVGVAVATTKLKLKGLS